MMPVLAMLFECRKKKQKPMISGPQDFTVSDVRNSGLPASHDCTFIDRHDRLGIRRFRCFRESTVLHVTITAGVASVKPKERRHFPSERRENVTLAFVVGGFDEGWRGRVQ